MGLITMRVEHHLGATGQQFQVFTGGTLPDMEQGCLVLSWKIDLAVSANVCLSALENRCLDTFGVFFRYSRLQWFYWFSG